MERFDPLGREAFVWRFRPLDTDLEALDGPGIAAPSGLFDAFRAVSRDLRCRLLGPPVDVDQLRWELWISADYDVTVGWSGLGREPGLGSPSLGSGLSMDAGFAEAAVQIADIAQTELAGYQFVQWPSAGRGLLIPRADASGPVWVDPHTGEAVASIGGLCAELG